MKKLLAILLTLAVLCSFGVSALAADTEVTTYTWDEVAADAAEIDKDGSFHQIGTYCIWLPSFYVEQELSEEWLAQGYIADIAAFDQSSGVLVTVDANEKKVDLEGFAKACNAAGMETEAVVVNGVPALKYIDTEADMINVMYLDGEDATVTFSIYPYSDENVAALSHYMISSLQPSLVWEMLKDIAAQVDQNGQLAQIGGTGLAMWIPSFLADVELTEEDIENGSVAYLATEDDSASVSIFVWGEDYDYEGLLKYYADNGMEDVNVMLINGIRAVIVSDEENDCNIVDYLLDNGTVLEFSFWPASDEGFAQVAQLMTASIQQVG